MTFIREFLDILNPNNCKGNIENVPTTIIPTTQQTNISNKNNSTISNTQYYIPDELDTYFEDAGRFIIEKEKASIGMLQRLFKIGFNRAAKIMDELCITGVVGEDVGTAPRKVLMNMTDFDNLIEKISLLNTPRNSKTPYVKCEYQDISISHPHIELSESQIIEQILGQYPDFSNDGSELKNLKNLFIYKCDSDCQEEILKKLVFSNSQRTMRLIVCDISVIGFNRYSKLPQLLAPIITDIDKLDGTLHWLTCEVRDRLYKFADIGVKNIATYNLKTKLKNKTSNPISLPYIIFFINEFYMFRNNDSFNNSLIQLLLNCTRVGIFCIFCSQFDIKNLNLGSKSDLFCICDSVQAKQILKINITEKRLPHTSLTRIDKMDGAEFENFCADTMKRNGFINVEVTQGSGDHGIDILAEKDDITYAIQCKCYSSNIGNAAVQQAHTGKSLYNKDIAVVLTNRYFTQQAIEEANALGVKLWDRDKLNSLISSCKTT